MNIFPAGPIWRLTLRSTRGGVPEEPEAWIRYRLCSFQSICCVSDKVYLTNMTAGKVHNMQLTTGKCCTRIFVIDYKFSYKMELIAMRVKTVVFTCELRGCESTANQSAKPLFLNLVTTLSLVNQLPGYPAVSIHFPSSHWSHMSFHQQSGPNKFRKK